MVNAHFDGGTQPRYFLRWNMGYGGVALYRKITCLPIFPLTFIIYFFPAQSHGGKLLFLPLSTLLERRGFLYLRSPL